MCANRSELLQVLLNLHRLSMSSQFNTSCKQSRSNVSNIVSWMISSSSSIDDPFEAEVFPTSMTEFVDFRFASQLLSSSSFVRRCSNKLWKMKEKLADQNLCYICQTYFNHSYLPSSNALRSLDLVLNPYWQNDIALRLYSNERRTWTLLTTRRIAIVQWLIVQYSFDFNQKVEWRIVRLWDGWYDLRLCLYKQMLNVKPFSSHHTTTSLLISPHHKFKFIFLSEKNNKTWDVNLQSTNTLMYLNQSISINNIWKVSANIQILVRFGDSFVIVTVFFNLCDCACIKYSFSAAFSSRFWCMEMFSCSLS